MVYDKVKATTNKRQAEMIKLYFKSYMYLVVEPQDVLTD